MNTSNDFVNGIESKESSRSKKTSYQKLKQNLKIFKEWVRPHKISFNLFLHLACQILNHTEVVPLLHLGFDSNYEFRRNILYLVHVILDISVCKIIII